VEIIITKVERAQLEKLYSIPPFENVNQFLVSIALVRGRLGKGGVPDLESSAVQVLRDWNTGKISYHTVPPAVHPSSVSKPLNSHAPEYAQQAFSSGAQAGEASIVKGFAPTFDISGLMGDADQEVFGEKAPLELEPMAEDDEALMDGQGDEMDLGEPLDSEWGGMEDYMGLGVLRGDAVAKLGSVQEEREEMVDADDASL
jgi:nuclear GTP-binding protein